MLKHVKKKTIKRDRDHAKALLKNMSTQLIMHEQIITTTAKAKFLRPHIEKLITKAKRGSNFNNVKYMKNMLSTDAAVRKMLSEVGPMFIARPGGYTRIIRVGNRIGDNSSMSKIELVERKATQKASDKKEEIMKKTEGKKSNRKEDEKDKTETKKSILKRPRGKIKKEAVKEK